MCFSSAVHAETAVESLERAYQEKINISAASNLWTNQSKKYRNYALISFIVLLVLITGSVWGLWWLSENFLSVPELTNFNQIKLTVLSTIVVGLLVYAVTLVGKFTISNLHMRTDALERSALTDFYLSLIKENAIDEDTRKIIIQSLFARSDSGLIKGGGDPTIPSNLSDLINKSK
ncbi:MAG: hypothetical protein IAE91_02260 [Ignavibacteriaceae bacterium]|nr:hypothetical protein [Ignavibacteriaceae bacterium]